MAKSILAGITVSRPPVCDILIYADVSPTTVITEIMVEILTELLYHFPCDTANQTKDDKVPHENFESNAIQLDVFL